MSNATDKKEVQINKIIHKLLERKMVIDNRINGEDLAIIRRAVRQDFRPINKVTIYTTTAEEFSKHFKRLGYSEAEAQECIGYNFNKGIFDNTTPLVSNSTLWDVKEELVSLYGCMYKTGYVQLPSSVQDMSIEDLKQDIYVVFGGSLKFNTITKKIEYVGFDNIKTKYKGKTLEDYVKDTMYLYCRPKYRGINRELVGQYIALVAEQESYNPVTEMLTHAKWDGVDRLPIIYKYLQQDDPMLQTLIHKWLLQCVAMAFNDGSQRAATVLVLYGGQGVGKSRFFECLTPNNDWYKSISGIDPNNKDRVIKATSAWIGELAEIGTLYKRDNEAMKDFITSMSDTYRVPYDKLQTTAPRTTSFGGTVNNRNFISDAGARRWVVVEMVNHTTQDQQREIADNAVQIWAQMYQEYLKCKDGYHLTTDEIHFITRYNADNYSRESTWEETILSIDSIGRGFTTAPNGKYTKVSFRTIFERVVIAMHKDEQHEPVVGGKEYGEILAATRTLAQKYGIRETRDKNKITFNLVDVGEEAPF